MKGRRLRVLFYVACLLPVDLTVGVSLLGAQFASFILRVLPGSKKTLSPLLPPHTATVTIQILTWDGRSLLEEFLPSVVAAAGNHEVLVVDNGSSDDSVAFLKSRFPRVRILRLDRNYGYSEGNNRGMKHAKTDVVVLLNNDMAVDPGFLGPLLKPFSDPSVFAVASQIAMAEKSKARFETGKTRARFESGLFYLWHDAVAPREESLEALPVFWAGGGACAIDRRKFEMLGGFDGALYQPFYVEDTDLSYQAWKRGWKALMAPASRVIHKHRGTTSPRFGELFVNNTTRRNHYLFVWKNVTDGRMLLEHIFRLPRIHGRAISQYGPAFEYRAYLRAVLRLPRAIRRRLAEGRYRTVADREILGASQ